MEPGPLPFAADGFDIVYSKDSILHIPDKETLAADVFRVLAPGGWFAASDWLISHDHAPSAEMAAYLKAEDLDFAMASPNRYRRALDAAGFAEVGLRNRNPWYRELAVTELAFLSGPERPRLEKAHGAEFIAGQILTWTAMIDVLRTGEHCPITCADANPPDRGTKKHPAGSGGVFLVSERPRQPDQNPALISSNSAIMRSRSSDGTGPCHRVPARRFSLVSRPTATRSSSLISAMATALECP